MRLRQGEDRLDHGHFVQRPRAPERARLLLRRGPEVRSAGCFGPASACATDTPVAGPDLSIDTDSTALAFSSGDGDVYLDNCESATVSFDVLNVGLGSLTNPRILAVTPSNPMVTITTGFPAAISPSPLPQGATGSGSFALVAGGLVPGETLTLQVEVTADELAASKVADLVVTSAETDLTLVPSLTYSFETGTEGWTTVQGTFNRSSAGGGAGGTSWYEQSSAFLNDQCDQIQSPVFVPSATSTLTLFNQFDIEPFYVPGASWYDRANVGVVEVATSSRTPVNPDGGRLYNASGANGNCGTQGQGGWADAASTWASSSWSAAALGSAGIAGEEVQLDIRYGTDFSLNGFGFRFDEVTLTDVSLPGPDGQTDICGGCTVDPDCDDGTFCNGAETCDVGTGVCQPGTPPACDDGAFCNGAETCNEGTDCVRSGHPAGLRRRRVLQRRRDLQRGHAIPATRAPRRPAMTASAARSTRATKAPIRVPTRRTTVCATTARSATAPRPATR